LVNGKSEKMLDISLIDKDLEQLAGILNQYNDNQRQLIASTLRHENYLKESIANISHDLRTPLTVILGHLQLLRKETLTDRQAQRIETIFHKAERMKELVQTFYDLSILDAEQITPRREDFNLSNLLINLITENAPALEAKNLSPEIDLPPHSVYLNSDYSMVERILQNLLTRSLKQNFLNQTFLFLKYFYFTVSLYYISLFRYMILRYFHYIFAYNYCPVLTKKYDF